MEETPPTTPNRFKDFREKSVSLASHQPVLFFFALATAVLCVGWLVNAMAGTVWMGWFPTSVFFVATVAGFILQALGSGLSRWLFVAAVAAWAVAAMDIGFFFISPLLAGTLVLVAAVPALERSGFRRTATIDWIAFASIVAVLCLALFSLPGNMDGAGFFRALAAVLCAGWVGGALYLDSNPLPPSVPAKTPRIAMVAGVAIVLAFFLLGVDSKVFSSLFTVFCVSVGIFLASLVLFALDDPVADVPGRDAGSLVRRYGPAVASAFHAIAFLALSFRIRFSFENSVLVAAFILLAAFFAMRCGWLKEESVRRSLVSAGRAVRGVDVRGSFERLRARRGDDSRPDETSRSRPEAAPSECRTGRMPISWFTVQGLACLILVASVVGAIASLTNENTRDAGVDKIFAVICGVVALTTAFWFLFCAVCRKFEEGVETLESRFEKIVRTPICSSWTILYQLGLVMAVVLFVASVVTGIAWIRDKIPGIVPIWLLVCFLALAPHFLNLFLSRRFHDGVCVLETAAGDKKPAPGPLPVSWYICYAVFLIIETGLICFGVWLVVKGFIPHKERYVNWITGIEGVRKFHDWTNLWDGVRYLLSAIPVAFGFVVLFLVRRFWSAVACLRVLAFSPIDKRAEPAGKDYV